MYVLYTKLFVYIDVYRVSSCHGFLKDDVAVFVGIPYDRGGSYDDPAVQGLADRGSRVAILVSSKLETTRHLWYFWIWRQRCD